MLALFQTIDLALNLYTWVLIGSAIFSWLYAFNVINSSNRFVNSLRTFLQRHRTGPASDPPHPSGSRRHRHLADRRASHHLLPAFADVEQHRSAVLVIVPYRVFDDHLRLAVRLTPNGGRDAIDGIETNADGEAHLKARVSCVPEKGKANKALLALVAKALGVPKSSISLVSGDTARQKILRIDGDPEDLKKKIDALTAV